MQTVYTRQRFPPPTWPGYEAIGCTPIGEVYVVGLLKPKRASVPTQTSNTELI